MSVRNRNLKNQKRRGTLYCFRCWCCCCALLALLLMSSGSLFAQNKLQTKTGVIKEITLRGSSILMTIEEDQGEEIEITITPKVDFQIRATGDQGFIAKGQFIQGQGILTNKRIFPPSVTVFLAPKGKKITRRGGVAKAPLKPGQSKNLHIFAGTITNHEQDKDYPEYELIALREAARGPFLMLKKTSKITVSTTDTSLLPEKAKIKLEGFLLRGGRFNLKKATINLAKPLKSDEVFAE